MLPEVLLMVATDDEEEVQVTAVVRSWVSPFANVPTALNCASTVAGMLTLTGVT